jgi:hypothetical protein
VKDLFGFNFLCQCFGHRLRIGGRTFRGFRFKLYVATLLSFPADTPVPRRSHEPSRKSLGLAQVREFAQQAQADFLEHFRRTIRPYAEPDRDGKD